MNRSRGAVVFDSRNSIAAPRLSRSLCRKRLLMDRRTVSASDRERVFERDRNRCVFCETTESLELAQIIAVAEGGASSIDNLITICPNCHRRFDSGSVRAFEFEEFVHAILVKSPHYSNIVRESLLPNSNVYADLLASRGNDSFVIECKASYAFVRSRFIDILANLDKYARHAPHCKIVLATLGELTDEQRQILTQRGYEHWGPRFFAESFRDELQALTDSFIGKLISVSARIDTESKSDDSFRQQLRDCPSGNSHWSVYQRLIGNILEAFFVPPLEKTIVETSDGFNVNRRDFVLPNYCTHGFWEFMRQQYSADYIVVDAKNYTTTISKKEILQIANYLKKHGTGLFAIIFSRKGAGNSARVTMREQWALYGKLIVVLNDDDLLGMLAASASRGNPDTILRQRIEEFRLSM